MFEHIILHYFLTNQDLRPSLIPARSDICAPLDFSDQRGRINFHQPKRTAPETAEDQTLQAPAAAHRVEWPTAGGERPDGLPDQPQPVSLLVLMRDF